jgi:hypothetical protein
MPTSKNCTATLAEFIDRRRKMHEQLPLVHSTLIEHFSSLATNECLQPRQCPVFNEPLIYLFYGRPAYRSTRGATPDTELQYCPICFIFKTAFLDEQPARIYPFDTGAAKSGRFRPFIDETESDLFALNPALSSIQKFTKTFFDSNESYILGSPRKVLGLANNSIAKKYFALVSNDGPKNYDDRRSSIEIQYRNELFFKGKLWAVAMPTQFLEHADIRDMVVSKWGAFPLTYNFVRGTSPTDYATAIREKYILWLKMGGMV